MTTNKPELYELSALMQRQAELFETMGDKDGSGSHRINTDELTDGTDLHWMLTTLTEQISRLYDLHRYVIREIDEMRGEKTEATQLIEDMAGIGIRVTELVAHKLKHV